MSAMEDLRSDIADQLCDIEDLCKKAYGLKKLTRFTLIARDPANDEMIVFVSNEPDPTQMRAALDAAAKQVGKPA